MFFVYSPKYETDIGPHVFPTSKYRLIKERLLATRLAQDCDFLVPEPASRRELELVHTPAYLDDLEQLHWSFRTCNSELPLTHEIANSSMLAAGGSILALRKVFEHDSPPICVHIGGGFHHAFPDHAEGFCYINDIAVAVRVIQHENIARRAMIVDCDLHQGNGSAFIFQESHEVLTLSIHQEHNYPSKQRSDIDIGLEDFAHDDQYLEMLKDALVPALESHKPRFLVYVAGADPYEGDQLGALKITKAGLKNRDELVLGEAAKRSIPTIVVMAGGYAFDLQDTIDIHVQTCEVALRAAEGKL